VVDPALVQAKAGFMQAYAGFAQAIVGVGGALAIVWAANIAKKTFGSTLETKRAEAAFQVAQRAITFAAKASSVYSHIRNPMSMESEGGKRDKSATETAEQTRELNYANLVTERINFHQEYWNTGSELRWEIEAVFGKVFGDAVEERLIQRNKIAVRWGIHIRYGRGTMQLTEDTARLVEEAERMVWEGYESPDQFSMHLEAQQVKIIQGLKSFVSLENSDLIHSDAVSKIPNWLRHPPR
jgi:hypothetical protein